MTGIRSIVITPNDGGPRLLLVQIIVDDQIALAIPGEFIATLHDALSRIRAEHPDLCGVSVDEEPERFLIGNPGGDPTLN